MVKVCSLELYHFQVIVIVYSWHGHIMVMRWSWHCHAIWAKIISWSFYDPIKDTSCSCQDHCTVTLWALHSHTVTTTILTSLGNHLMGLRPIYERGTGRALVSGHIMGINRHSWSFMTISLPCLGCLKVVLGSLCKVITGSWLIIPRQSQL